MKGINHTNSRSMCLGDGLLLVRLSPRSPWPRLQAQRRLMSPHPRSRTSSQTTAEASDHSLGLDLPSPPPYKAVRRSCIRHVTLPEQPRGKWGFAGPFLPSRWPRTLPPPHQLKRNPHFRITGHRHVSTLDGWSACPPGGRCCLKQETQGPQVWPPSCITARHKWASRLAWMAAWLTSVSLAPTSFYFQDDRPPWSPWLPPRAHSHLQDPGNGHAQEDPQPLFSPGTSLFQPLREVLAWESSHTCGTGRTYLWATPPAQGNLAMSRQFYKMTQKGEAVR